MKSTIGNLLQLTLFGESHGEAIGCVVDGLAPGVAIDTQFIAHQMELRKPKGSISTQRKEADEVRIVSGVFHGKTCGTPLCILIENTSQHSKDYEKTKDVARPSHADYTAQVKYGGYQDYRGGGHFSGRLTAPLVAVGAICLSLLKEKGILIGSHIASLHGIDDDAFSSDENTCKAQMEQLNEEYFAVLNPHQQALMQEAIEKARLDSDSVGGIIETMILGMPSGIGEPYFHSLESELSHLLFSVGAVKGVEFGLGFELAQKLGSEANDALYYQDGKVKTKTNHNGGINGGISNGMPIQIRTCIKPTPSIYQPQETINMATHENTTISIEGRHDPCIVHRARVVLDSVIAIGLVDLLMQRYGILYFAGEQQ